MSNGMKIDSNTAPATINHHYYKIRVPPAVSARRGWSFSFQIRKQGQRSSDGRCRWYGQSGKHRANLAIERDKEDNAPAQCAIPAGSTTTGTSISMEQRPTREREAAHKTCDQCNRMASYGNALLGHPVLLFFNVLYTAV